MKNKTNSLNALQRIVGAVMITMAVSACNLTKYVPDNDALYTGADVKMEQSSVPPKVTKVHRADLEGLIKPDPNSRILGIPFKLMMYNLGGNKEKGIGAWISRKFGEAPVLLSQFSLERNTEVLRSHMENRGFFHVRVAGDTTVKNKKAEATFTVRTGPQYTIENVYFPTDSSVIERAIAETQSTTLLKAGAPFDLDLIKGERNRIDAHLKETGFYYFSPDHLIVRVDSTIGAHKVNMYVQLKPETPLEARQKYAINDVFIYSNYNLNTAIDDTSLAHAEYHNGYYVVDSAKTYKPFLFDQMMMFDPNDIYNRRDHNLTLRRLTNLATFKFVKNRFQPVYVNDSAKLNAYYYLTPLPKKSLRAELSGLTKSNNITGSQLTLGWRNRNAFRGAELLMINVFGGAEVQYSGQFQGYNTYRLGGEATLSLPRFLIPFYDLTTQGAYVPKTNLTVSYEMLNRRKLYTLNSFRGDYGYSWKESITKEHLLNPVSINYVQPANVTKEYRDSIPKNPTLEKAIREQFIIGSNYNYNYNQLLGTQGRTGLYFNGLLDLSGNVLGLITGAQPGDRKQIFGARFAQYIKTELDTRYYLGVGLKNQWANRLILGFGYPYGNSDEIPFIKQFFIGGNNSIRAFRSRSLGPGSYRGASRDSVMGFLPDQSGDIKLEMNTEYRAKLFSIVEGAVFVDAGNIWLYRPEPIPRPGATFSKDFLKELAVGTGVGIRLDLTILLLRFDLAFPLRIPSRPEGDRWVIDEIEWSPEWRRKNLVFNLGIGYPF